MSQRPETRSRTVILTAAPPLAAALVAVALSASALPASGLPGSPATAAPAPAFGPAGIPASGEAGEPWIGWLGCWMSVEERAADTVAASGASTPNDTPTLSDTPMLCIRPAEAGSEEGGDGPALEVLTVQDAGITGVRLLVADGEARQVSDEGCEGTVRVRLSGDGTRIYRSSRLDCQGIRRSSSAVWDFVSPTEWVEVQSMDVEGRTAATVMRYRPADPSRIEAAGLAGIAGGRDAAVETARMAASAPPGVEDVVEAHGAVGTEVTEAWLAEQGEPLRSLRSRELLRLADAGVPARVIDVAVAVSYPDRFQVDREPYGREAYGSGLAGPGVDLYGAYPVGWGRYSLWRYPYLGYPGYRGYGRGFYDPYRYRYRYYGQPYVIVVRSISSPDRGGRVIAGQGYRRGAADGATSPRTDGATGKGTASPAGHSGGKATGRKAKPRGSGSSGSGSGGSSGSGSGGSSGA